MGWLSNICLQDAQVAKKMHRVKGGSTDPDLRAERVYILLCSVFYTWKDNRKPLLKRRSMADLSSSLGNKRSWGAEETNANTDQFLLP